MCPCCAGCTCRRRRRCSLRLPQLQKIGRHHMVCSHWQHCYPRTFLACTRRQFETSGRFPWWFFGRRMTDTLCDLSLAGKFLHHIQCMQKSTGRVQIFRPRSLCTESSPPCCTCRVCNPRSFLLRNQSFLVHICIEQCSWLLHKRFFGGGHGLQYVDPGTLEKVPTVQTVQV